MARQTSQAMAEPAATLRGVVRANAQLTQSTGHVSRSVQEQATAAAQLARTTVELRSSLGRTAATVNVERATQRVNASSIAPSLWSVSSSFRSLHGFFHFP
jgi:methyl-accepting chemotaxis protein